MADPTNGLDADTRDRIDGLVADFLAEAGVPGVSVAVVDGDATVLEAGHGARHLDSNAPATPRTLYGVGSCTKSFTALAIQQLAARGALALDDAVADHVDHLSDAPGEPVTIADLLSHSSGMPSDGSLSALLTRLTSDGGPPIPLSSEADFRRHVEGSTAERVTEGDPFFYYNAGYALLGEAIEAADGRPYAEFVREEILDPLGMARSTFDREAFESADDRMTAYRIDDGEPTPADLAFDAVLEAPGGLFAPVAELSNYLRMAVSRGSFEGERLLEADRFGATIRPRTTRRVALDGTEERYGYGWQVTDFLRDTLVDHGGSMGVTSGYLGFLADADVGVAIGCNASPSPHPTSLGRAILAVLRGASPEAAVPRYALAEKFDPLTGEYASYREITTATVERHGGRLRVELGDDRRSHAYVLLPETLDPDDRRFFTVTATGERLPVRFEVSDDRVDLFLTRWRLHRERR